MKKIALLLAVVTLMLALSSCNAAFVDMKEEKTSDSWNITWSKFKGEKTAILNYDSSKHFNIVNIFFDGDYENLSITFEQGDRVITVDMSKFADKTYVVAGLTKFDDGEFTVRLKADRCFESTLRIALASNVLE